MFRVDAHFELKARGVVIVGTIQSGVWKPGAEIRSPINGQAYRVRGVESIDNTATREYKQGLLLERLYSLAEVVSAFPVGTNIGAPAP